MDNRRVSNHPLAHVSASAMTPDTWQVKGDHYAKSQDRPKPSRRNWEARHQGPWDEFKDTVRYAWENVRGRR